MSILQGLKLPCWCTILQAAKLQRSKTHHLDWSEVDLEALPGDAVPVTSYKPIRDGKYDQLYTHWTLPNGDRVAARDYYRIAWRAMAANTGERTLIPALIPPGTAHINGVFSYGFWRHQ